jgi:2-keto-3-deoxy-6-phosphogluconate aldolase
LLEDPDFDAVISVTPNNVHVDMSVRASQDFQDNGVFAVGIGSALTRGVTACDYTSVRIVAREFMDKLASINARI